MERRIGLENLDLPRYRNCRAQAADFLDNPGKYFDAVGGGQYFVWLQPSNARLPIRQRGLDRKEAIRFVTENIPSNEIDKWEVHVTEYYPNIYGGNIIISSDGSVTAEFHPGSQGVISAGNYSTERYSVFHTMTENSNPATMRSKSSAGRMMAR
jgi:hypothetical protein